jgi:hypothetical protein
MQAVITNLTDPPDTGASRGAAPPQTGFSAVFRREDDQICHTRCGSPLGFRGVRGRQEADFYCLTCTSTVTVPVVVLEAVFDAPATPPLRVVAGRGRREKPASTGTRQAA